MLYLLNYSKTARYLKLGLIVEYIVLKKFFDSNYYQHVPMGQFQMAMTWVDKTLIV